MINIFKNFFSFLSYPRLKRNKEFDQEDWYLDENGNLRSKTLDQQGFTISLKDYYDYLAKNPSEIVNDN